MKSSLQCATEIINLIDDDLIDGQLKLLPLLPSFSNIQQGAPVFLEGGACATAQWHNGQSNPGHADSC